KSLVAHGRYFVGFRFCHLHSFRYTPMTRHLPGFEAIFAYDWEQQQRCLWISCRDNEVTWITYQSVDHINEYVKEIQFLSQIGRGRHSFHRKRPMYHIGPASIA